VGGTDTDSLPLLRLIFNTSSAEVSHLPGVAVLKNA
jgi:hypothetical protein